ncbi:hypothetical protein C882_0017 [Caenispirillum salinarum AK4]|uniref:Uncharacterized protein n=1 Tax=Caenispirillum salinarum AK4 TaxID=1238182 RepID=K9H770_9PROT|nr:hypothetical protein C882_0017 [Caenispirillum salinarum AK4]
MSATPLGAQSSASIESAGAFSNGGTVRWPRPCALGVIPR